MDEQPNLIKPGTNISISPGQSAAQTSESKTGKKAPDITTPQVSIIDHHYHKPGKGKFVSLVLVLLLIIFGLGAYFAFHNTSTTPSLAQVQTKTTASQSTNHAENRKNTEIKTDEFSILVAAQEYIGNNKGTLPSSTVNSAVHTLQLCGATNCTEGATVKLSYFKASDVAFHAYSSDLAVKNYNTVYIVDNATCANSSSIGAQMTSSVAILYGFQNDASLEQQCQSTE